MVWGDRLRVTSRYADWLLKSVSGFWPSTNWKGSSLYWFTEYRAATEVLSLGRASNRASPTAVTMLRGALVLSCRRLTDGRFGSWDGYAASRSEMMARVCASVASGARSEARGTCRFPLTSPELKAWPKSSTKESLEVTGPPVAKS